MSGSSGNIYGPGSQSLGTANSQLDTLSGQNFASLNGNAPQVAQTAQQLGQQYQANPYVQQAQTGANAASAYGTGTLTPQLQQGATALSGVGGADAAAVPQALQAGFDPQNALYNRSYTQNLDQQNAINSMNGVGNTPYGAGITGDSARNFNIDWGNNQLQRQNTAANTASTLTGGANTGYQGASTVGNQAVQTGAQAAALPSSTYTQNIMSALQALSGQNTAVGGAVQNNDQALSTILQYLGYGTNATTAQQKESDANSPLAAIGALAGINTGGGGTAGGDALAFLGL